MLLGHIAAIVRSAQEDAYKQGKAFFGTLVNKCGRIRCQYLTNLKKDGSPEDMDPRVLAKLRSGVIICH